MAKGVVKFFNEAKGFGFIIEAGSGTEHFVQALGLIDQVNENDTVEYELAQGKRGLIAINVRQA